MRAKFVAACFQVEYLGRKNAIGRTLALRGRPKDIVDRMEEIHDATGRNGGFILAKGIEVPGNLRDFVEYVVPELQRRGLYRTAYEGRTLRENLGVRRPTSRYAMPRAEAAG